MSYSPRIHVALAFNHKLFRNTLQSLIERDDSLVVTASISSGIELVQALHQTEIDIVLFDYSLPILYGESAFRLIQSKNRCTKVIVLSIDGEQNSVTDYVKLGANAYLTRDCNFDELITTIKNVYAKENSTSTTHATTNLQFSINGELIKGINNCAELIKTRTRNCKTHLFGKM